MQIELFEIRRVPCNKSNMIYDPKLLMPLPLQRTEILVCNSAQWGYRGFRHLLLGSSVETKGRIVKNMKFKISTTF